MGTAAQPAAGAGNGKITRAGVHGMKPEFLDCVCWSKGAKYRQQMPEPLKKTFAEFFAGIGLMRIGLELGGWNVVFANDIEEDKWRMYRDHFGDTGEFVLGDIHKLDPAAVPTVALATASFPCNDLSLAGARKGLEGSQSSAFWGFVDILSNLEPRRRPPLVLLEMSLASSHQMMVRILKTLCWP